MWSRGLYRRTGGNPAGTKRASRVKRTVRTVLLPPLLALSASCASLNIYTLEQDSQLGLQAYEEILAEEKLVTSGPQLAMVRGVTDKLVAAVKLAEPEIGQAFDWEVRLIDNDEVPNAFCLPGGKMAVYTGILPVAEAEAGLAVVMGHEIAHATRRHGTQAVTRGQLAQVLSGAATAMLDGDATAGQVAAVTAGLVQLKYGRSAELQADKAGLTYMALAGFDPREAVAFWTRMSGLGGGPDLGALGEWLSTHPSDESRIEQIEELLPEALEIWKGGPQSFETPPGGKSIKR